VTHFKLTVHVTRAVSSVFKLATAELYVAGLARLTNRFMKLNSVTCRAMRLSAQLDFWSLARLLQRCRLGILERYTWICSTLAFTIAVNTRDVFAGGRPNSITS